MSRPITCSGPVLPGPARPIRPLHRLHGRQLLCPSPTGPGLGGGDRARLRQLRPPQGGAVVDHHEGLHLPRPGFSGCWPLSAPFFFCTFLPCTQPTAGSARTHPIKVAVIFEELPGIGGGYRGILAVSSAAAAPLCRHGPCAWAPGTAPLPLPMTLVPLNTPGGTSSCASGLAQAW